MIALHTNLQMCDVKGLSGTAIAVFVDDGAAPVSRLSVDDGEKTVCVEPSRYSEFLREHWDCRIACLDAFQLREMFARSSGGEQANQVRIAFDRMLKDGKVLDMTILRCLLNQAGEERSDLKVKTAREVWNVFRQQMEALERVEKCHGVDENVRSKYGPLGLTLEVQANIAASQAWEFGLRVDSDLVKDGIRQCEEIRDEQLAFLTGPKGRGFRDCLRGTDGVEFDANDYYPKLHNHKVEQWLLDQVFTLADVNGGPVPFCSLNNTRISTDPHDWWRTAPNQSLLSAHFRMISACQTLRWLQSRPEIVRPQYDLLPLLSSKGPNLQNIKELQLNLFVPSDGHQFLVVRFPQLRLRALATILNQQNAPPKFPKHFRSEDTPQTELARLLREHVELTSSQGAGPESTSLEFWENLALALLRAIEITAGAEGFRSLASAEFELDVTASDASNIYKKVREEIYPELNQYWWDDTFSSIAANFQIDENKLVEHFGQYFGEDISPPHFANSLLRRGHRKCSREMSRNLLMALSKDQFGIEAYEKLSNNDLWNRVTDGPLITPTGRVRHRATLWERLGTKHIYVADAVVKKVLFELVVEGNRAVGFTNDEILLEIPIHQNQETTRDKVRKLVDRSIQEVLPDHLIKQELHYCEKW